MPAPVAADLIDASDDIVRTMRGWALYVQFGGDHPWRAEGLEAGIDGADAWDDVNGCAEVILDELDSLANDSHQIEALWAGVAQVHGGEPSPWRIADAAARYALDDQPQWANVPCPDCDLKVVRVQPGRNRRPTRYRCTTSDCGWEANSLDDGGLWASFFAEPVAIVEDVEHPRVYPHLLNMTDAARLAERSVATIRKWIKDGDLMRELGRVKEQDVLAVAARKRGESA